MADAGAAEAVDGIVDSFAGNLAPRVKDIGAAVAAGNAGEVARLAHTFKSSAAQLGAVKLASLLRELEAAAKAGGEIGELFGKLREEARLVEGYLAKK
jgi:HPt (histidine-containing phosphotransfer) domain-containing protein